MVWKPVAKMITSTGRSTPSAVTILSGPTSSTASVTSSTSGRCSVGYQSSEIRIRLQPIG